MRMFAKETFFLHKVYGYWETFTSASFFVFSFLKFAWSRLKLNTKIGLHTTTTNLTPTHPRPQIFLGILKAKIFVCNENQLITLLLIPYYLHLGNVFIFTMAALWATLPIK